eukprot:g16522.t1
MARSLPGATPNLTHYLTGGIRHLFLRIANPISHVDSRQPSISGGDGFLQAELISNGTQRWPELNPRYQVLGQIAQGTFSQLFLAVDLFSPLGQQVAIKVMNMQDWSIGEQEASILLKLQSDPDYKHTSLVKLVRVFRYRQHLCLVLERLGPSLLELVSKTPSRRLSQNQIRKIALQLVGALCFLESHKVIHADIKPENVLLTWPGAADWLSTCQDPTFNPEGQDYPASVRVKLVDFGNSVMERHTRDYQDEFEIQTLYYRAPEVVFRLPFSFPIDMWSLGCLLVELAQGKPLFPAANTKDLIARMFETLGPLPYERFKTLADAQYLANNSLLADATRKGAMAKLLRSHDPDYVNFISSLLEYDPDVRLKPQQALTSDFLRPLLPVPFLPTQSAAKTTAAEAVPDAGAPVSSSPPPVLPNPDSSSSSSTPVNFPPSQPIIAPSASANAQSRSFPQQPSSSPSSSSSLSSSPSFSSSPFPSASSSLPSYASTSTSSRQPASTPSLNYLFPSSHARSSISSSSSSSSSLRVPPSSEYSSEPRLVTHPSTHPYNPRNSEPARHVPTVTFPQRLSHPQSSLHNHLTTSSYEPLQPRPLKRLRRSEEESDTLTTAHSMTRDPLTTAHSVTRDPLTTAHTYSRQPFSHSSALSYKPHQVVQPADHFRQPYSTVGAGHAQSNWPTSSQQHQPYLVNKNQHKAVLQQLPPAEAEEQVHMTHVNRQYRQQTYALPMYSMLDNRPGRTEAEAIERLRGGPVRLGHVARRGQGPETLRRSARYRNDINICPLSAGMISAERSS